MGCLVLDLPADRIVYHFSFSLVNVAPLADLRARVFLKSIRLRSSTSKHIPTLTILIPLPLEILCKFSTVIVKQRHFPIDNLNNSDLCLQIIHGRQTRKSTKPTSIPLSSIATNFQAFNSLILLEFYRSLHSNCPTAIK